MIEISIVLAMNLGDEHTTRSKSALFSRGYRPHWIDRTHPQTSDRAKKWVRNKLPACCIAQSANASPIPCPIGGGTTSDCPFAYAYEAWM